MQIGNFKLTVLELEFEPINKNYRFYGSYYRGMLGRYLLKRFCLLRNAECSSCPIKDRCLYMLAFERYENALFPPYIVNRAEKDRLRIVLLGSLTELSHVYMDAFLKQLEIKRYGYYHPFFGELQKERIAFSSQEAKNVRCEVENLIVECSFLRIKKNSRLVSCEDLTFDHILRAVEKRIYLANKFYGNKQFKVYLPEFSGVSKKLNCGYERVKRYSHRKRRFMEIPSINCSFEINGRISDIFPFLYLASFLNIGTNAPTGFGQISLRFQRRQTKNFKIT